MSRDLLTVRDLSVRVEEKSILKSPNLSVKPSETHVLMGPNSAGKSTLGNTLMDNPHCEVIGGSVEFQGQNLLDLLVNERVKASTFVSFQNPLEVPGINLANFIWSTIEQKIGKHIRLWDLRKEVAKALEVLSMGPSYVDRDLNAGFSDGEKRKIEILQLLMPKPSPAIPDETDSGLDMDAVRTASHGVEEYRKDKNSALIIITHNMGILSSLKVDKAYVPVKGSVVADGGGDLVGEVNHDGFAGFESKE